MKQLTNKVALVTGGSRGIGAAITGRLAADGARVAFTYVQSAKKAEQLVDSIKATGGEALALAADGADPHAMIRAVKTTIDKFGRIDILVNNAGIYIGKPFTEHTLEDYRAYHGRERACGICRRTGSRCTHAGRQPHYNHRQ